MQWRGIKIFDPLSLNRLSSSIFRYGRFSFQVGMGFEWGWMTALMTRIKNSNSFFRVVASSRERETFKTVTQNWSEDNVWIIHRCIKRLDAVTRPPATNRRRSDGRTEYFSWSNQLLEKERRKSDLDFSTIFSIFLFSLLHAELICAQLSFLAILTSWLLLLHSCLLVVGRSGSSVIDVRLLEQANFYVNLRVSQNILPSMASNFVLAVKFHSRRERYKEGESNTTVTLFPPLIWRL